MSRDQSRTSPVRGVCAAALTPITNDFEPDLPAVVAHCRRLFALGCDAINLLGTTGEAMSFSLRQRLRVMQAIAESDLDTSAFMVGTGAAAFEDAVTLTRAAVTYGFAGALVMPPFYFKDPGDDGLVRFFERLVERVGHAGTALYLYHFPKLSGIAFAPQLVARLVDALPGVVVGLKDSSGVAGFAESIVAAASIDVFPSSESMLSVARERGFAGCISATLNVSAPLAARVWRGLAREQDDLSTVRTAIAGHPLVPALRALVATLSHDDGWRRPMPPLDAFDRRSGAALLERLDAIPAFSIVREAFACA